MEMPEANKRLMQLIEHYSGGNVSEFANRLDNISQQKLNRIFNVDSRTKKYPRIPSDVISAIGRVFPLVDPIWLLTGLGKMLQTEFESDEKQNAFAEDQTEIIRETKPKVFISSSSQGHQLGQELRQISEVLLELVKAVNRIESKIYQLPFEEKGTSDLEESRNELGKDMHANKGTYGKVK